MGKQACRRVLFLMAFLCGFANADANHLKNVKFKIFDESTNKPLQNRELNICRFVYFKQKPVDTSPYLDKNSDLYITSAVTDGNGVFVLDLSLIKETEIVVESGKPYNIVRFTRTPDLEGTKSVDHVRVAHLNRNSGELTTRIYDLKRGMVKVITYSKEMAEEPFTEILLPVKKHENELYGEAETVMLKFQQALKESGWAKALSYCSNDVKAKAGKYNSPKDFFAEVVPVKELILSSQFPVCGGKRGRDGEQVEYNCFVPLMKSGEESEVRWDWVVKKGDAGWFIDFKTISLEQWVEQEHQRYKREDKETKAKREEIKKGIETRLIAISKEFVIGKPMLFRLEITNVSDLPIEFEYLPISRNVCGPDGNSVKHVDWYRQTTMSPKIIKAGETIIFADKYDIISNSVNQSRFYPRE